MRILCFSRGCVTPCAGEATPEEDCGGSAPRTVPSRWTRDRRPRSGKPHPAQHALAWGRCQLRSDLFDAVASVHQRPPVSVGRARLGQCANRAPHSADVQFRSLSTRLAGTLTAMLRQGPSKVLFFGVNVSSHRLPCAPRPRRPCEIGARLNAESVYGGLWLGCANVNTATPGRTKTGPPQLSCGCRCVVSISMSEINPHNGGETHVVSG